jgi:hypothetical protein
MIEYCFIITRIPLGAGYSDPVENATTLLAVGLALRCDFYSP